MVVNMAYEGFMMSKLKQCAVCEGHYDTTMLANIMDTYICHVCALDMDGMMKEELGDDYRKGMDRTTTRHIEDGIAIISINSSVHPKPELEPTTA